MFIILAICGSLAAQDQPCPNSDYVGQVNEEGKPGQKFVATGLLSWTGLEPNQRILFESYFSSTPAGEWARLSARRNDVASVLLSVSHALAQVSVDVGSDPPAPSALDLINRIIGVAGNDGDSRKSFRVYVRFSSDFEKWVARGKNYELGSESGSAISGGGSVHPRFNKQFKTIKAPNLQWNYRDDFQCGDIDVDGFTPSPPKDLVDFVTHTIPDIARHLQKANSDARQWYGRYLSKFDYPGFLVTRR